MEEKRGFTAVILAAGKGTRMKSDLPKVMHPLCGRPMINYVVDTAENAGADEIIVVIGHGGDAVREVLNGDRVTFAVQEEQLGTAHAVGVCREFISGKDRPVVILCGDAPLITASTITELAGRHGAEENAVTILTAHVDDPSGYGRVVKDGDEILRIVEEKDASPEEKKIREINSGVYCVDGPYLLDALSAVGRENAQGEYYLTDIVRIGKESGKRIGWAETADADEIRGINSRKDLAAAEEIMRRRILDRLMNEGVTVVDPSCTYVDHGVRVGRDSILYPQARLEGPVTIGDGVIIETGSIIRSSSIGSGSHVKPYSVITDSVVKEDAAIGPFAHLRPGSIVEAGAKVGNFVEMKKSVLGRGSKANHLTYIGDCEVGEGVNIGAGTITCNYDGYGKFRTVIEDGAFIGSGTNLVAPVTVGRGSVIGAGSTITRDVPPDSLALTRPEQKTVEDWARKRREKRGRR